VYAPTEDKKKRRKRDDPNLILGPEAGTEEIDLKGRHVYFEPQGAFQENELRDQLRGNPKGILLKSSIPKSFTERMAKGIIQSNAESDVEQVR
jgi:hypothetical protein